MSINTCATGNLWDKTTWRTRTLRDLAVGCDGVISACVFGPQLMAELVRSGIYQPGLPPEIGDSIVLDTESGPADFFVYRIGKRILCEENRGANKREFWFDDEKDLRWHTLKRVTFYALMSGDLGINGKPREIAQGIWEIGRKRLPGRDASKVLFIERGVSNETLELAVMRDSFTSLCLLGHGTPPRHDWHSGKTLVAGVIEVRDGRFATDVFEDLSASQRQTSANTRIELDDHPPRLWICGEEFCLPTTSEGMPTDGCRYLAYLFDHVEKPITCWDLYLAIRPEKKEKIGGPMWSDEILDESARLQFRARLMEARAELKESELDPSMPAEELEQAREKVHELEEQAAKLFNKAGRSRQIVEGDRGRARQRVRKALAVVIRKVASQDGALGAALAQALGDGDLVTFRPPPEWRL